MYYKFLNNFCKFLLTIAGSASCTTVPKISGFISILRGQNLFGQAKYDDVVFYLGSRENAIILPITPD